MDSAMAETWQTVGSGLLSIYCLNFSQLIFNSKKYFWAVEKGDGRFENPTILPLQSQCFLAYALHPQPL